MLPGYKKLYRSREHRIIAGVCGGIAEYFETDPVLVRIIFIFLSLIGAGGILLYLILWAMLEEKNTNHKNEQTKEHPSFANEVNSHMKRSHHAAHGMVGFFIVLVGIVLLLDNFFPGLGFEKFWPVFLILFGAAIMFRHN
jgi:phage shock protein PspC (stress-responsive transcriptional regulator)